MTELMSRGLIIGGGGVLGIAWEVGILHALTENGIDLGAADEIIGTSAGAFAGCALVDPRGVAWSYERQLSCAVREISANFSPEVIDALKSILGEFKDDDEEAGRRLGAFSLAANTIGQEARLEVVRARLGRENWPSGKLSFTAVDADTGKLHLLNEASGMSIMDAAAATGAAPGIWPVVHALDKRWIDGGSVSVTNAHLAERFANCLVISPMTMNFSGISVQAQLDALRPTTFSMLIIPDVSSVEAIGTNPFDAARRPLAAKAGYVQGQGLAKEVSKIW